MRPFQTGVSSRCASSRASLAILLLALTGWFGGCTSSPEPSPKSAARNSALNQEVRNIEKKQDQFGSEVDTLFQDIQAFRGQLGQPGWNELVPILKSTRMVRGVKGPADAAKGQAVALKAWGDKWDQSPDTVFQRYQQLVERSSAMEKRRKALVDAWTNVRAQEEARLRSSDRYNKKDINTIIANETMTYEMNRANLNLFGPDELGLFTRIPQ